MALILVYSTPLNLNPITADNIRIIVGAEENGDKVKLAIYDSNGLDVESDLQRVESSRRSVRSFHGFENQKLDSTLELCLELMFGAVPLAFKGTSTKIHVLPVELGAMGVRRILITRLFSLSLFSETPSSPSPTLSSSWGSSTSNTNKLHREFPFPTMTPIASTPKVVSSPKDIQDGLSWHPSAAAQIPSLVRDDSNASNSGDLKSYSTSYSSHYGPLPTPGGQHVFQGGKHYRSTSGLRSRSSAFSIGVVLTFDRYLTDKEDDSVFELLNWHWEVLSAAMHELQRTLSQVLEKTEGHRHLQFACLQSDDDLAKAALDFRDRLYDGVSMPRIRLYPYVNGTNKLESAWSSKFLTELRFCSERFDSKLSNLYVYCWGMETKL